MGHRPTRFYNKRRSNILKISELIEQLEKIQTEHGDIYLSIRHLSHCEFSPMDDLTDIRSAKYEAETNMATIRVVN